MGIDFRKSAGKHGIPQEDVLFAVANYAGFEEIDGFPGQTTRMYVGHPHGQTDRYIEVGLATWPPDNVVIFHAMPLTDLYRHLI
jgi:hypothetical protein